MTHNEEVVTNTTASCRVSVCMATYNGSRFVGEQITSILSQLEATDELIVVDDASRDRTVEIVEAFADPRIRVLRNEQNQGVIKSFERAIGDSRGDYVFLSDQDDIWTADKVKTVIATFEETPSITLVMSDAVVIDEDGKPTGVRWNQRRPFAPGIGKNMVRNSYVGCLMAFRRELIRAILPFPEKLPMHDMWIGMVNQLAGSTGFIDRPLVYYRRHQHTVTGHRASWRLMAIWRFRILHLIMAKKFTLKPLSR